MLKFSELLKDANIDATISFLSNLNEKDVMKTGSIKIWRDKLYNLVKDMNIENKEKILESIKEGSTFPLKLVLWLRICILYLFIKAKELGVTTVSEIYTTDPTKKIYHYKKACEYVYSTVNADLLLGLPITFTTWTEESGVKESKYYDFIGYTISKHSYIMDYKAYISSLLRSFMSMVME